jgi:hypothetical protein
MHRVTSLFGKSHRPRLLAALVGVPILVLGVGFTSLQATASPKPAVVNSKTFTMFPAAAFVPCLQAAGKTAKASGQVTRGPLNDTLTLSLSGFKPNLGFDLFTVQRSNQQANGSPVVGFKNFGMAWYQSDIETSSTGTASVTIKTILLDQIFGFDPDVALAPTNTFHVGFWFDNVNTPQACSTAKLVATPFNGEHNAGPLAFITRPNAMTGVGPLCTQPIGTTGKCNP